jgi:hypothetical protein
MSFDALMKSDGKIFGVIVQDFLHLENICFWSELINQQLLDRKEGFTYVPDRLKSEWERTKLSQNEVENFVFFRAFSSHIANSKSL